MITYHKRKKNTGLQICAGFPYLFSKDLKYIPREIYNTQCLEFQVAFKILQMYVSHI